MLVKTKDGIFQKEEKIKKQDVERVIDNEDIYIIESFFREKYYGVFDRDIFSFVNTNIKVK